MKSLARRHAWSYIFIAPTLAFFVLFTVLPVLQAFALSLENATIVSPRGPFRFGKAHNPVQDIYLREVKDGKQRVVSVALKDAEDPAAGCALGK